jgi:hypothetical protein
MKKQELTNKSDTENKRYVSQRSFTEMRPQSVAFKLEDYLKQFGTESCSESFLFALTSPEYSRPVNRLHTVRMMNQLQEICGNRRVQSIIQAKMKIGKSNDKFEQEADRIADEVMRMPERRVQWQLGEEAEQEQFIQRNEAADQILRARYELETQGRSLTEGGRPLPKSVRSFFEPRLGYRFNRVRIYRNPMAAKFAKALNSRAFTLGTNVFFAKGQYSPDTARGRRLLAHELTHVVQQNKSHFRSRPVIQCWGPGVHEELTENGVKQIFSDYPGFKMNREALSKLVSYSASMDFNPPEISFNWRAELAAETYEAIGPILGGGHPPSKERIEARKVKAYRSLVAHYKKNPEHAKNHGEGGLYCMSKSEAAKVNKDHQMQYERKAAREFNKLEWEFHSEKDCHKTKSEARQVVLKELGDALHIAQDRGAHGEGAVYEGHGREIFESDFDPDDIKRNKAGYVEAKKNTDEVLLNVSHFLIDIFENVCRWRRDIEPEAKSIRHQLAPDLRISEESRIRSVPEAKIVFAGQINAIPPPGGVNELNWKRGVSVKRNIEDYVENYLKGKHTELEKFALGVTFIKSAFYFTCPKFNIDILEKTSTHNGVQYFAKVQSTTSAEPAHEAFYAGPGPHNIGEFSLWVWGQKKKQIKSIYIYVGNKEANFARDAEQEHLDDAHQAYLLSYADITKQINTLAAKEPIGPTNSRNEAISSAKSELEAMLPKPIRAKPERWPKILDVLLELTYFRDVLGWHATDMNIREDESGNIIMHVSTNKDQINKVSSKELVNFEWFDYWGSVAIREMRKHKPYPAKPEMGQKMQKMG